MRVQFAKWGNSVALRIPAVALRDLGAGEGTPVDLSVEDGRLVLTPIAHRRRKPLSEYVARITSENVHGEYFDGPPRGTELW